MLFTANHRTELCNVSYLAKEFNITKATVSDVVKILLKKDFLEKDLSPKDNRRYNLIITSKGDELVKQLSQYSLPVIEEVDILDGSAKEEIFELISKLI